ncbi:hypothetical protein LLEC1_05647 [Akanthomyces lecanii]|uniref:Zn(2)-C6 fungal-type domain-containing protein n=1 Tax=Cordyceps confragosa TaxID=2714763 RepID=A0A179IMI1_CORDF|nr:hypothetical protein LLEC1_05647 [Akanthomyces lecanii]
MNRSGDHRRRAGKRNATACEHCRAAKARCQPSEQPGVCQKYARGGRYCGVVSTYTLTMLQMLCCEERVHLADQGSPAQSTAVFPLAARQPFVLLAILTVTSGSRSVQKHSLYDDEFLKILGLKYVSGGDGSLELLRGLLIYCAWIFFTFQLWEQGVRAADMDKIRLYLAYVYLVSTCIVVWKGDRFFNTRQPPWTAAAINILEQFAETDDDRKLAISARLSTLFSEAAGAVNGRNSTEIQNSKLVLVGLSRQYQQLRDSYAVRHPGVLNEVAIRLQMLYLDIYLDVGSLLTFPVAKTALSARKMRFAPTAATMSSSAKKLGAFLRAVGELDDAAVFAFTVNDWTRFVVVLTLAFRLSFPLALAPDFDWLAARKDIRLEQFLSEVSRGAEEGAGPDGVLAANRAVLGVLRSNYSQREKTLAENAALASPPSTCAGCPAMGGSGEVTTAHRGLGVGNVPALSTDADMPDMLPMLHSMWATGGTAWQDMDKIPWDLLGAHAGGDGDNWAVQ